MNNLLIRLQMHCSTLYCFDGLIVMFSSSQQHIFDVSQTDLWHPVSDVLMIIFRTHSIVFQCFDDFIIFRTDGIMTALYFIMLESWLAAVE